MIRRTWLQMGMPITVCLQDAWADEGDVAAVASWLETVDRRFSPYLASSEVSRLNSGELPLEAISDDFAWVLEVCEQTKVETDGYFDVLRDGRLDPSGLVKGWAIERSATLLGERGLTNYLLDAGGDVRATGRNGHGQPWRVGIRNPFQRDEVVRVLAISDGGVATSGTAVRGQHIYNPRQAGSLASDVVSLTVIGPSIFDADRFATAAFAMGRAGLPFIAARPGFEGYAITADGLAQFTEGFRDDAG